MNPFEAIRTTFYMLLAQARGPIQDHASVPAATGVDPQSAEAEPSVRGAGPAG